MDYGLLTKDILYRFHDELINGDYDKIVDHYTCRDDRKTAGLVILMYKFITFNGLNAEFSYVFPTFEKANRFWGNEVRYVFNQFISIPEFKSLMNEKNIYYGSKLVDNRGNQLIGQDFEHSYDFDKHYKTIVLIDENYANPICHHEAYKDILTGMVPTHGDIIHVNTFKYVSKYDNVFHS